MTPKRKLSGIFTPRPVGDQTRAVGTFAMPARDDEQIGALLKLLHELGERNTAVKTIMEALAELDEEHVKVIGLTIGLISNPAMSEAYSMYGTAKSISGSEGGGRDVVLLFPGQKDRPALFGTTICMGRGDAEPGNEEERKLLAKANGAMDALFEIAQSNRPDNL